MTLYADVILSLPLDQAYSYEVPEAYQEKAQIGSRVLVPFKQGILTGIIVRLRKKRLDKRIELKEINEVLDERPVFSPAFLAFTRRLSEYFYSSWGELLLASLPPSLVLRSKIQIDISERGEEANTDESLSTKEKEILSLVKKRPYSEFYLRRRLKTKNITSLLSRLEKKGLIHVKKEIKRHRRVSVRSSPSLPTQLEMDFSLDEKTRKAADLIAGKIRKNAFSPFFLYGHPSKRRAVYLYLIRNILSQKKKVLFLVPEISLTKSLVENLKIKLGENAALLHSRLSERMKEVEWNRIKDGEVDVVVGPRSALFSPLSDIGMIIVDEEQDESYFQQESPSYDARKGAWQRATVEGSAIIYGSECPSVEAFNRAKKGGYLLCLEKDTKKFRVEIVDDRKERRIISQKLKDKIKERLERREPVLFFINRRGYASFLICSQCSNIPHCRNCDVSLTYHKKEGKLVCHYCNYSLESLDSCPVCGSRIIRKKGIGIEVVEEEIKRIFPQSSVACFDMDVVKKRGDQEKILSHFYKGKIDILIGTQLLAHRVDLPKVSLVAVLYPETLLTLSDFRASQRTYQNLNQMMKFLRNESNSELIIQTSLPQHRTILAAAVGDYSSFFEQEMKYRQIMEYPPFAHMAEVLFQELDLRTLARKARDFSSRLKSFTEDIEIMGPALAGVSRVRGKSRVQIILKSRKKKSLDFALKESLREVKSKRSIYVYE